MADGPCWTWQRGFTSQPPCSPVPLPHCCSILSIQTCPRCVLRRCVHTAVLACTHDLQPSGHQAATSASTQAHEQEQRQHVGWVTWCRSWTCDTPSDVCSVIVVVAVCTFMTRCTNDGKVKFWHISQHSQAHSSTNTLMHTTIMMLLNSLCGFSPANYLQRLDCFSCHCCCSLDPVDNGDSCDLGLLLRQMQRSCCCLLWAWLIWDLALIPTQAELSSVLGFFSSFFLILSADLGMLVPSCLCHWNLCCLNLVFMLISNWAK